jgi:peptide/nickel transport system substrate-binding protein
MTSKYSKALVAGLASLSLVLAACGSQTTSTAPSAGGSDGGDGDGGGPSGEVVTIASSLTGQGEDVNTQAALEWSHKPWWDDVHDYVIEQDADGNLVPGLATEWAPSEDGLTWTFTLREDVLFHNGDTMTAEDVAWSWNRVLFDPGSTHTIIGRAPVVESITADGNQVVVVTTSPQATLPMWFAELDGGSAGAVYSQAYFEEVGDEMWDAPVGTGPYKLESIEGDQSATLVAFTDEGRSDWQKERTAGFERLTIRAAADPSTRVALVQTGEADVVPLPLSAVEELEGTDVQIVEVPAATQSVMYCLGFSLNPDSPCNDIGVREALSIAIDRQGIADSIYRGYAVPSAAFMAGAGSHGNPDDLEAPPYDPDRAAQLLADAGFDESNPLQVEIVVADVPGDMPLMPTLAEAIAGNYADIGVEATVRVGEEQANKEALFGFEFNGQEAGDPATPITLYMRGMDNRFYFVDEQATLYTDDSENGSSVWNEEEFPDITDQLRAIQAEFDFDVQGEMMADFHRSMAESWLHIPLLSASAVFGLSDNVASWDFQVAGKGNVHNQWSLRPAD